MTDDKAFASPAELREIASLADALAELSDTYSWVDFDNIQIGDSNGDNLGVLQYESGVYLFRANN